MAFKKIDIRAWKESPVKAIADDWALVTAGTPQGYNTMIWGRDAAFIFIRRSRYTLQFIEENDAFTVCFFPPQYKKALAFCGSRSGRDCDKAAETGLHPVFGGAPYFEEASVVLRCRKMAKYELTPDGFLDPSVAGNYADGDYHRMFIGAVEEVLIREEDA